MTNYITLTERQSWEPIKDSNYNLLIVPKLWSQKLTSDMVLHPFNMGWDKHNIKYELPSPYFCKDVYEFIATMAMRFSVVADTDDYLIEFEHVTDSACKTFHDDKLNLRLICTLWGDGATQWLEDSNVNFHEKNNHHSSEERNDALIKDKSKIHNADIGDVLIMKGSAGNSTHGLMHRSFPLETSEQGRWVLKISEMFI